VSDATVSGLFKPSSMAQIPTTVFTARSSSRDELATAAARATTWASPCVPSVIEMRHGKVWARSNIGEAVRFNFTLPIKEDV